MSAQSKPSQQQAENFHGLPKDKAAMEKTPAPAASDATDHAAARDAETGSLIGISNTGEPERITPDDRSKVS
jgi:hypothetical protein